MHKADDMPQISDYEEMDIKYEDINVCDNLESEEDNDGELVTWPSLFEEPAFGEVNPQTNDHESEREKETIAAEDTSETFDLRSEHAAELRNEQIRQIRKRRADDNQVKYFARSWPLHMSTCLMSIQRLVTEFYGWYVRGH